MPRQTLLETIGQAGAWHRRQEQAGHASETWNNGAAPDADRDAVALARRASGHGR